jgi:hypothetical protein
VVVDGTAGFVVEDAVGRVVVAGRVAVLVVGVACFVAAAVDPGLAVAFEGEPGNDDDEVDDELDDEVDDGDADGGVLGAVVPLDGDEGVGDVVAPGVAALGVVACVSSMEGVGVGVAAFGAGASLTSRLS